MTKQTHGMAKYDWCDVLSRRSFLRQAAVLTGLAAVAALSHGQAWAAEQNKVFQAGAYAIDITPEKLPVLRNGGFHESTADKVYDPLHARCLVLDDGNERVAIAVVDNCVMPGDLLDEAKELAHKTTGIPTDRMLISSTHTHSAPAVMAVMGCRVDATYREFLPGRIAQGIEQAAQNLAPAKVGWAMAEDFKHTYCRRWILRPDKVRLDPFGQRTVRATMFPGFQNPDFLGPSGPVDPDITMLSVQSPTCQPIAVLANYSMHFIGHASLSADYFGAFAEDLKRLVGAENAHPPFVGIMSQGTSGDLQWLDFSRPGARQRKDMYAYAEAVARLAHEAYRTIEYHDWVPLAMCEKKLTLGLNMPTPEELAQAEQIIAIAKAKGRKPHGLPEIFAQEQVKLAKRAPTRQVKIQALRIGELGIVAAPGELFGITGLKLKARSPLQPMFTIAQANDASGYYPPPAQHILGGYTTWPKCHAAMEVEAEPKLVAVLLDLLEEVSGKPRRPAVHGPDPQAAYPQAVLASKPIAYWQLNEFEGPAAIDASGNKNDGIYEGGLAFYLEGPASKRITGQGQASRAVHFAGGRIKTEIKGLPADQYTAEMWFCNYLPADARATTRFFVDPQTVTGYLFSRGPDGMVGAPGDHFAIDGTADDPDCVKLLFFNGNALAETLTGRTTIQLKTWNHVAIVRNGQKVAVYLNGDTNPEMAGEVEIGFPPGVEEIFIGGRCDNIDNFEGRICQVAIYNRVLPEDEIARHYTAAVGAF